MRASWSEKVTIGKYRWILHTSSWECLNKWSRCLCSQVKYVKRYHNIRILYLWGGDLVRKPVLQRNKRTSPCVLCFKWTSHLCQQGQGSQQTGVSLQQQLRRLLRGWKEWVDSVLVGMKAQTYRSSVCARTRIQPTGTLRCLSFGKCSKSWILPVS